MMCMENKKTRFMGYMTVKEAAEYLGVSPMTLRRWDRAGKLKARRHPMNNFRLYSEDDISKVKKMIEGGEE